MTRWETLARRVVIATAAATGALLLLAMGLSYAGLRSVFLGGGFPAVAASLFPLPIDLLIVVGYVGLLTLPGKAYPLLVVAGAGLASAGAQGYHQSHGGITAPITDGRMLFALGASAMVCALVAGHLLWLILERALPADFISAMRGATQPPLEPAAPPPTVRAPELDPLFARDREGVAVGLADYGPKPGPHPRQVLDTLMQPLPPVPPPVQPAQQPFRHRVHIPAPEPVAHAKVDTDGTVTQLRARRPRRSGRPSQAPQPCWCSGNPGRRPPCEGKIVKKSTWYRHNPQAAGGTG